MPRGPRIPGVPPETLRMPELRMMQSQENRRRNCRSRRSSSRRSRCGNGDMGDRLGSRRHGRRGCRRSNLNRLRGSSVAGCEWLTVYCSSLSLTAVMARGGTSALLVFLVNRGAGPMGSEASKQDFSEVERNHARVERTVLSAKTCQEQRSRSKRKLIPLTRVARTHPRRLCRSCPR
jgi:hypothetical protein